MKKRLQENIGHLEQILNVVQGRVNALDPDLTDTTRRRRIKDLWKQDFYGNVPDGAKTESNEKIVGQLMHNIRTMKSEFTEQRKVASDPNLSVLTKAIQQSGEVNLGDALLAQSLNALDAAQLAYIARTTNKPAILLAVKSEMQMGDFGADDKAVIQTAINDRSQAFVDRDVVVSNAECEKATLEAELSLLEARGELKNPIDKLTVGRQIAELEGIIGGADER